MVDLEYLMGHILLVIFVRAQCGHAGLCQLLLNDRLELAAIDSAMGAVVVEVALVLAGLLVHWHPVLPLCLGSVPQGAVILGSTIFSLEPGHNRP